MSEGVNETRQHVMETLHPYERGKIIPFEQITFHGAIALVVDFDKKCQSDQSHDFLVINSWDSDQRIQLVLIHKLFY